MPKKPKPIKGLPRTSDIVEACQRAKLDPKTLALLVILRNSMNLKNKKCWKSYSYLAKEMNVGRNTAYRAVQIAVEAELITVEKFERNNGYAGNIYRFNFPWTVPKMGTGSRKSCTQNGDRACTQNGDSRTQTGDRPVPKMVLKSRQSKSSTKESVKDNQEEHKCSSSRNQQQHKIDEKENSQRKSAERKTELRKSKTQVLWEKKEEAILRELKKKFGDNDAVRWAISFVKSKLEKAKPDNPRPYAHEIYRAILLDKQPDFNSAGPKYALPRRPYKVVDLTGDKPKIRMEKWDDR